MSTTSPSPDTATAIAAEGFQPIASYGLLADCNSAALVDRDGSIGWLCLPRYDSPAVFAQILDPSGGHWRIRPAGEYRSERRYVDGTLVIETTFTTETGSREADRRDGVRRGAAPSRARDGRAAPAASPGRGRLR